MRLHLRAVRLLPLLLPVLLLPVRGEAQAGPECTPSPVQESFFADPGSKITEIAAVGSTLFFGAEVGGSYGLWKFDPQAGTPPVRLNPISSWPADVNSVSNFTVLGQKLFFVVKTEVETFLWATNETHTGIYQVGQRAFPGSTLVDGPEFTVLGSTLFFRADTTGDGPRLWMSNGTDVAEVVGLNGSPVFDPLGLTVLNGKLFFSAWDAQAGYELWTSDEAQPSARRLMDLRPGNLSSVPGSLRVMGDKLYFTATTTSQDADLWVSDGTVGGTQMAVGPNKLGTSHGPLLELTVAGDKLFFHMNQQGVTGDELWVSDGTEANTRIVKEIQTGISGGSPKKLTAVGRMLFFMALDPESGEEPWRSDGTEAGTFMVREFVGGTGNSLEDEELKAGPGVLLLSIFEDASGKELWSISETEIVRLTDIFSGTESSSPHGMTILGDRLYFATAPPLPLGQGHELYSLPLTEVDCKAPSVECPGPLEVEAVSPLGALVFLPPPKEMSDDSFTPLTVEYSPAAAAIFPLGTTPTTITVRDRAGHAATCSPPVIVQDTMGPELVCPQSLVEEATGPEGANVTFPLWAWDAVSGVSSVDSSHPSGSPFSLGLTETVTVTATDGRGNPTSCQFPVTVKDTVPPKLTCPSDIVRVATSAEPVTLSYAPLELHDAVYAELTAEPSSPHAFELGKTEVKFTARDNADHVSDCSFSVYIVDPVAPTITCPGPQQAVAFGPEGAVVVFPEATAEDELAQPTIRYSAEPGSTFPVGETTVTATASDRGGNEASCSFTVTVTEQVRPSGCGCRAGSASASVYWLLLAFAPLWARRRAGRLAR